jgi:hypothetical protein
MIADDPVLPRFSMSHGEHLIISLNERWSLALNEPVMLSGGGAKKIKIDVFFDHTFPTPFATFWVFFPELCEIEGHPSMREPLSSPFFYGDMSMGI